MISTNSSSKHRITYVPKEVIFIDKDHIENLNNGGIILEYSNRQLGTFDNLGTLFKDKSPEVVFLCFSNEDHDLHLGMYDGLCHTQTILTEYNDLCYVTHINLLCKFCAAESSDLKK